MALPMVRTRASERARRTNDPAVKGTSEDFTTTRTNEEGNKMKQIKLNELEKQSIEDAARELAQMIDWHKMPDGHEYWAEIHEKLCNCVKHGTNDGKPWVEPELTDEDAIKRPWVKVKDYARHEWSHRCVRLVYVKSHGAFRFTVEDPADNHEVEEWNHARLATPEEIEAANVR
jgi:uncharacterized protein YdhG (YjbR/CyaY superfamily)